MTTTATPSMMPKFRTPTIAVAVPNVAVEPDAPIDLPNVVKAKRLESGMKIRAVLTLDGVPTAVGGTRTVADVSPVDKDGMVTVSFSSLHPTETFKAARRFQVQEG